MKRFLRLMMTSALIGALALFAACSDDTVTPTTGSVSGKVTFQGTWPTTGEVQVSIYSTLSPPWVPMGAPHAFTDPIQSGLTEFDYTMSGLDKGAYAAVFVGWRDPQDPAGAKLIGMYWAFPDSVGIDPATGLPYTMPTGISINDANLNHSGINITADLDLAP